MKWRRQVIEIPVAPVRVIEHRIVAGYCGVCQKRYMPRLDLTGEVVGNHRVGIRLMSLVAYLAIKGRMTKRTIQSFLEAMHGLHLGLGEITSILHTAAGYGREEKTRGVMSSPCFDEPGAKLLPHSGIAPDLDGHVGMSLLVLASGVLEEIELEAALE